MQPGSGRPRNDRTEEHVKTVESRQQAPSSLQIRTFYQNLVPIAEYHVDC